jgi:hypothetical protein
VDIVIALPSLRDREALVPPQVMSRLGSNRQASGQRPWTPFPRSSSTGVTTSILNFVGPSTPPTPPAASRARACAPTRCRLRSSASVPSRSCRTSRASLSRRTSWRSYPGQGHGKRGASCPHRGEAPGRPFAGSRPSSRSPARVINFDQTAEPAFGISSRAWDDAARLRRTAAPMAYPKSLHLLMRLAVLGGLANEVPWCRCDPRHRGCTARILQCGSCWHYRPGARWSGARCGRQAACCTLAP